VPKKTVTKKAPIRKALKEAIAKPTKVKPVEKVAKPKIAAVPTGTKYQKWVAEAIQQLTTPEHPYVSLRKIKRYAIDYFDGTEGRVAKLVKQAIAQLVATKQLKGKKDSYTFSKTGAITLAPSTVEKRKKIPRPEKVKSKPPKDEPARNLVILGTGRVSKPRAGA
jgi:hypothetical protein